MLSRSCPRSRDPCARCMTCAPPTCDKVTAMISKQSVSPVAALFVTTIWIALCLATLQLFEMYDTDIFWDREIPLHQYIGVFRFGFLVVAALLLFAIPQWAGRLLQLPSGIVITWTVVVCVAALLTMQLRVSAAFDVHRSSWTLEDEGRSNYVATWFVRHGVDPWGPKAVADFDLANLRNDLGGSPACEIYSADATRDRVFQFSDPMDPPTGALATPPGRVEDLAKTLIPSSPPIDTCPLARETYRYTGLKYGPVMLASYLPFVAIGKSSGIYFSNLLFFIGIIVCVTFLARRLVPDRILAPALALLFIVVPTAMARCTLLDGDCDNLPVFLGLFALVLLDTGREKTAAVMIGLSVGAKLVPGALFVPLLLGKSRKTWFYFAATLVIEFMPAMFWDAKGLFYNLVWFNATREPNPSGLAFHIPAALRSVAIAAALAGLTWTVFSMLRRGWTLSNCIRYLLIAVLITLGASKVLHNNYLVWLQPLCGLEACAILTASRLRPAFIATGSSRASA